MEGSSSVSLLFGQSIDYALGKLNSSHLSLKDEQRQAVQAIFERRDVFVWLPTGFGKSICFQTLPFMMDYKLGLVGSGKTSAVVVVSPLVSLMVEQVQNLRSLGVKASIITSGSGSIVTPDLQTADSNLLTDSLFYCAPEALFGAKWREAFVRPAVFSRIVAVVIDEAHCVTKWSENDFRPSFGRLAEMRALVPPGTPYMACTATATRKVHKGVISILEMEDCVRVSLSPDRPNIFYEMKCSTDIETDFSELISSVRLNATSTPRVIVYCRSLDMCSTLYAHFHYELGAASYHPPGASQISDNRLFGMFHASTPCHNKDVILQNLLIPDGIVKVVFATVALGMGVNVKEVNTVIHYGAPRSIDDYFQESGRAGRSGDSARSIVFWKPSDCPFRRDPVTVHHRELNEVRQYLENTSACRRVSLVSYFDPKKAHPGEDPIKCCDVCCKIEEN